MERDRLNMAHKTHQRLQVTMQRKHCGLNSSQPALRQVLRDSKIKKEPDYGDSGGEQTLHRQGNAQQEASHHRPKQHLETSVLKPQREDDFANIGQLTQDHRRVYFSIHAKGHKPHAPPAHSLSLSTVTVCRQFADSIAAQADCSNGGKGIDRLQARCEVFCPLCRHRAVDALKEAFAPEDVKIIGERMMRIDVALTVIEGREITAQGGRLVLIGLAQALNACHALAVLYVTVAHNDIDGGHHHSHYALDDTRRTVVAQRDEHQKKDDTKEGQDVTDDEEPTARIEHTDLPAQRFHCFLVSG